MTQSCAAPKPRRTPDLSIHMTGPQLKARREELNLTQQKIADAIGVKDRQVISRWECGGCQVGIKHLVKLAQVLQLDPSALLS